MDIAAIPVDESERLGALADYEILDTVTEKAYDELTELAAAICGVPIALISLVDSERQWFKSHHGLDVRETPRDVAFCSHAILGDRIFEICNSYEDARFSDNPLVTGEPRVVFYAGAPLATPGGQNVGTLCVIDHQPRKLDARQRHCLEILARQAVSLMELRKAAIEREKLHAENRQSAAWIERRKQELARFAYRSSHDLRAPAVQLHSLARLVKADAGNGDYDEVATNAERLQDISEQLLAFIDGIIEVGRAELISSSKHAIDFEELVRETSEHVRSVLDVRDVALHSEITASRTVESEYPRLRQMLAHLVSNGIRYANRDQADPWVRISVRDAEDGVELSVEDNGIGIPAQFQSQFFDMFRRFHPQVQAGSGVGTTIVKRHATAIGARISVASGDAGTRVSVCLPGADRDQDDA